MARLMGTLGPTGKVILSLVGGTISLLEEALGLSDGTSIKPSDNTLN